MTSLSVNPDIGRDPVKEVEHILHELGTWRGTDADTGFHLVEPKSQEAVRICDKVWISTV